MRFKAIPSDVAATVKAHPALAVAGVALLIGGAYLYTRAPIDSGDNSSGSDYGSYIAPVTYDLPLSVAGAGAFSQVGSVAQDLGSDSNTAVDPNTVSTKDLFDFEKLKEQHDYDLSLMQLQQNADITAANTTLGLAGIQASNFSAAASLAASMFQSGATSLIGAIFGPNGEQYSFGMAQTIVADSKKNKKNAGILASNQQGQTALANFLSSMNQGSTTNGTLSGIGTSPNASYGSPTIALPYSPGTSIAATSLDAGYSSNSGQYATNTQIASSDEGSNASNGGSRILQNISSTERLQ